MFLFNKLSNRFKDNPQNLSCGRSATFLLFYYDYYSFLISYFIYMILLMCPLHFSQWALAESPLSNIVNISNTVRQHNKPHPLKSSWSWINTNGTLQPEGGFITGALDRRLLVQSGVPNKSVYISYIKRHPNIWEAGAGYCLFIKQFKCSFLD